MRNSRPLIVAAGSVLLLGAGSASAAQFGNNDRAGTWEYGFHVLYVDSTDLDFKGGSRLDLDDQYGLAIDFGYHVNNHLELQFAFDWLDIDYAARIVSASTPLLATNLRGSMESFTPRGTATWYFGEAAISPYVTGGIGWAFIDTNIPNGPPGVGCWFDPWWGTICTPYQTTKGIDEFVYDVGAGIRWDISRFYSLRFGYEKRWLDLANTTSDASFDMLSIGIRARY